MPPNPRRRYDLDKIRADWTIESVLIFIGWDRGRYKKCRCPLPDCQSVDPRKSASFAYDLQRYYCHRCKSGGDVIQLIMAIRGCEFKEACAALSHDTIDELPPEQVRARKKARAQLSELGECEKWFDALIGLADEVLERKTTNLRTRVKNGEVDDVDAALELSRISIDAQRDIENLYTERQLETFRIRHGETKK